MKCSATPGGNGVVQRRCKQRMHELESFARDFEHSCRCGCADGDGNAFQWCGGFEQVDGWIGDGRGHEQQIANVGRKVRQPFLGVLLQRSRHRERLAGLGLDLATLDAPCDLESEERVPA